MTSVPGIAAAVPQSEQAVIFINYRRTDAGWAADLLANTLKRTFGDNRVFLDAREIDAGDEFGVLLEDNLRRATVLIVLIGKGWLEAHDKYGRRRLDKQNDWVRLEIRRCLEQKSCRVIPVLIDDAKLPDEREALPDDITGLLERQYTQVRQTNSDDDIEALSRQLEKAGFKRISGPTQLITSQEFNDKEVLDVAVTLENLRQGQAAGLVRRSDLLFELSRLFNRKTFRFEALRECPDQRWADRLDSAYQTEKVLRIWERNVREVAEDKYPIYVGLLKEVGSYCMQMGVLLFKPPVDYNRVEEHIGKPTFKEMLPPAIHFDKGRDMQPIIPDEINDAIDRHRTAAVALMDQFVSEDK